MIVWDCEDYLKKASEQLEDNLVYLEVPKDLSALASTTFKSIEKIRKLGDLPQDTQLFKVINGYMMYMGDQ